MTKLTAIFITFIIVTLVASVLAGITFNPLVGMITACGIVIAFGLASLAFQK